MLSKYALLSGAALCLSGIAAAQSTQNCPTGATNCTISVQDAGHNSLSATADNSTTTSSIAGASSASNQSGNTVSPVFDNSPQTTQNATTTTGAISSASTGNTSANDNASSATNGNQTMGQSNTGTSTSGGNTLSTGASTSSTGASSANTGASSANTGASTSSTGASNAYLGGNTQANGSASTVGATTSASGGNSLGSDASNSGGNSTTEVDASDRSSYKSIFIPPVVPGTPPSQLAIGNIIKETSACGPLQRIVRVPVTGTFIGLFRTSAVPQGFNDDLEPMVDDAGHAVDYRTIRLPDGDTRLFGHQVIMFTTVVGIASNRNIALGGGGGSGSWGQGGMGSSSSNQRMVTTIQLRDCEIGTLHTVYVEVPPKPIRG